MILNNKKNIFFAPACRSAGFTSAGRPSRLCGGAYVFNSWICILVFFVLSENCIASSDTVKYSKDFEFKEGIYLSFENFRNNKPIPKNKIVSEFNINSTRFISDVVSRKSIVYLDTAGTEQKTASDKIWGYCQNRTVYVYFNSDFNRIPVIGSLCHFVAEYVSSSGYYDPNYYGAIGNTIREIRQYVLDTQSGKVADFNVSNMEILLQRDEVLYKEFMGLKKKKKRESLFLYLRKYNEKNPFFFIVD